MRSDIDAIRKQKHNLEQAGDLAFMSSMIDQLRKGQTDG